MSKTFTCPSKSLWSSFIYTNLCPGVFFFNTIIYKKKKVNNSNNNNNNNNNNKTDISILFKSNSTVEYPSQRRNILRISFAVISNITVEYPSQRIFLLILYLVTSVLINFPYCPWRVFREEVTCFCRALISTLKKLIMERFLHQYQTYEEFYDLTFYSQTWSIEKVFSCYLFTHFIRFSFLVVHVSSHLRGQRHSDVWRQESQENQVRGNLWN